jgi:hypothetical protein
LNKVERLNLDKKAGFWMFPIKLYSTIASNSMSCQVADQVKDFNPLCFCAFHWLIEDKASQRVVKYSFSSRKEGV